MRSRAHPGRHCRGASFVETCAALGVIALLLAQALPAFLQFHSQQQLRSRAEALASDLRLARAEAARLGESVFFRVSGKGRGACYLIHVGARNDCDCDGATASCKTPSATILKAEWLPEDQPVRISSNAETLEFQFRQGLVTQTGSIELRLPSGAAIRQVVALTGRARSCFVGAPMAQMPRCA